MPFAVTIPLLGAVFPNKDLLATVLINYGSLYFCARDGGLSNLNAIFCRQKEYVCQFDHITDFIRQFLNREAETFFGAVLPATTFYNCVHVCLQKESAPKGMPIVV